MNFKVGHKVATVHTPYLIKTIIRIKKSEWSQQFLCVLKCKLTGDIGEYWMGDLVCSSIEQQHNDFLDKIEDRLK